MAFLPGPQLGVGRSVSYGGRSLTGRCRRRPQTIRMGGVLVTGAGGDLGLGAVRALVESKSEVVAVSSENSDLGDLEDQVVQSVTVDEKNTDQVREIIEKVKPESIVNCIGLAFEEEVEDSHYLGSVNLIDAAVNAGVRRFVLVSALGAGDSEGAVPFQVMETMRPMLMDKSRTELYLRESGMDYTIVRCGPLHEEPTETPVLTQATLDCYGAITVKGLASLLCNCISSEKSKNQTLTAVDTTKLLHVRPYVRPREFWEPVPFEIFDI